MIDVVGFLNTNLPAAGANQGRDSELGKDAFLELLIAQVINQNPLEPMKNTEFIAQLAQFSSLEQMKNIASGMELLALTQGAATNSQMVNLIGKRVMVPGDGFTISKSSAVELRFSLDELPKEAWLQVRNENGELVRRISLAELKNGENSFWFDGRDEKGEKLATGNYSFEIVGNGGEKLNGAVTFANFLVQSVYFEGNQIWLKSWKERINLADISEVILDQGESEQ